MQTLHILSINVLHLNIIEWVILFVIHFAYDYLLRLKQLNIYVRRELVCNDKKVEDLI